MSSRQNIESGQMVNWDRSVLGKEFVHIEQQVTREMLIDYAEMMGATNPIYVDSQAAQAQGYRDIIAMSAFVIMWGAQRVTPPEMEFKGGGINAGYECTFYEVIYPGDTLTYSTCIADLYEKTGRSGTMRFVVRETTVTNQHGDTVAVVRNPFILGW